MEGDLAFPGIKEDMSSQNKIRCHWYQKSTHTGILLIFGSCAPLQLMKNEIHGTVHRVFKTIDQFWPSISSLKRTKYAGSQIKIQMNILQK